MFGYVITAFIAVAATAVIMLIFNSRRLSNGDGAQAAALKISHEAEHEAKLRQQQIYDANPFPASLWNENRQIIACNNAMVRLLGMSDKDDYTERFYEFTPEFQQDGTRTTDKVSEISEKTNKNGYCRSAFTHLSAEKEIVPCDVIAVKIELDSETLHAVYVQDLRPMQEAAEKLKEAEARAQALVEVCPLGVSLYDTDWNELSCNPAALEMFGLDETYEYGKKTDMFMQDIQPCGRHTDVVDAELYKNLMEKGSAYAEISCLKADGTPMLLETDYVRLDYSGYSLFASFCRDLTEERAAQEMEREKAALELAQQRVTAMLNASPLACFILNANFEVLELNREAINLFGAKNEQDFIENFIRTTPEYQRDGEPSVKKMGELMMSSEEYLHIEWTAQTFQGVQFPCELHATRFFNAGEKMVIVHMRDLRDFYAYQEMNKRIRIMFDTTPLIIEYWDESFMPIDCNKATLDFYGQSKEEYEQHLEEIRHNPIILGNANDSHRSGWDANIKKIFETGHGRFDWIEPMPDGSAIPLEVEGNRVTLNNEPIVITYSKDVTELKKLQREQEELLQKLEAASMAKSKFLSNMSHEIRTPMSAIIGMASIAKNTNDVDRMGDCIIKIEKASNHLLGIINQILDISKIEAEQFKLDSNNFQLEKIVDEVISVLSVSIEEKSLALDVNLDENIPDYIVSDETRLAQVLTNLLINAVKFTPEGGKVSLTTKLLPGSIMRVEVADTGIGIPKELSYDLFDAFVQVEMSATRSFAGTGLGLPISKKIVEMMGGEIWFESEPGEGTCFILEIPVEAGSAEQEDTSAAITEDIEHGQYKDYTVLIAEDLEINREIVCALLEPTGIKIECATDGEQVVQMFRDNSERYDLILMDIQMPKMDGLAATRLIRELGTSSSKSIPIVAMTANVFSEDVKSCLKAGMNDHLSKPLDFSQIMAMLRLYLQS